MAMATYMCNLQARFRTRQLIQQLNQHRNHAYDTQVHVNHYMRQELTWGISQLRKWNGRNIVHTSPTVQIFTDASNDGWGIVLDDHFYSGQ